MDGGRNDDRKVKRRMKMTRKVGWS